MKSFTVLAVLVAAALAGPVSQDPKDATIVVQELNNIGVEGYSYRYKTSDGQSVFEEAILKNAGTENEFIEVRGEYSFYAPDGIYYTVTYVADEKGYRASGAHLPKA